MKLKVILPVLAAAIVGIMIAVMSYVNSAPITRYNFQGTDFAFRDDLRAASNVSISPNEEAVLNAVWGPQIQNITIVYTNSSDNQMVAVNAFELTYKLSVAYGKFGWFINFNGKEVDSFNRLNGTESNLVIALVPPSQASDTSVELNDHVVYIKGRTQQEFDRATIKFLMSALGIKI